MLYFKEIKLYPTAFTLDVVSCSDDSHFSEFMKERYGLKDEDLVLKPKDLTCLVNSKENASIGIDRRLFLRLSDVNDRMAIVHEIVHVIYLLSSLTNLEINENSQEWVACFNEMLFKEITKPNYNKITKL